VDSDTPALSAAPDSASQSTPDVLEGPDSD
jgi:hypothetical protein